MKVLAGPRLDIVNDPIVEQMCRRLAGEGGSVVSLAALGLRNPHRPLSTAEVAALREALRGESVIGYVCRGVLAPKRPPKSDASPQESDGYVRVWVAVTDHVNLTWRSPLAGPNDERVGPRFPAMADIYTPEAVLPLGGEQDGMIVSPGVVAGVSHDLAMSDYEIDLVARQGWAAVSSELVAPVIIAAHMGVRVAAVVMAV